MRRAEGSLPRGAPRVSATALEDGTIILRVEAVPPVQAPDELLTLDRCGLDDQTARRLIREGTLPAARLGRRYFVRRSDVLGLIDKLPAREPLQRTKAVSADTGDYATVVALAQRGGKAGE